MGGGRAPGRQKGSPAIEKAGVGTSHLLGPEVPSVNSSWTCPLGVVAAGSYSWVGGAGLSRFLLAVDVYFIQFYIF